VPHEHAENAGTRRRRPQNRAVALDPLENKIGTDNRRNDYVCSVLMRAIIKDPDGNQIVFAQGKGEKHAVIS
jgi:hypothetical protein